MNPALQFLPLPPAGPGVVGVEGDGGAGLAADAGIALVVEREQRVWKVLEQQAVTSFGLAQRFLDVALDGHVARDADKPGRLTPWRGMEWETNY